jgi:hypothetical protein
MHEINTAAEAITAAADPDANIIFGATISPDLEGEIIITVVATGFDASYFTKRTAAPAAETAEEPSVVTPAASNATEQEMQGIDMELKEHTEAAATDFHSDEPMPSIWSIHDDEEKHDETASRAVVSEHDEDELERPSFLRRLRNRGGNKDESADGENPDSDKQA